MSNSPEEIINSQIWKILQGIKEEYLITPEGQPVKYRIPNVAGVGVIVPQRRIKILYALEEKGAIKIHRNKQGARIGTGDIFYFYINESKFEELYNNYNSQKSVLVESVELVKDGQIEVILADLDAKYSDILQEKNDNNFYLKLADYGRYLLTHPLIEPLTIPLFEQSKKDVSVYKEACDAFIKKWRVLAKDLVEQAVNVGIADHPTSPFINQINEINGKLNEVPSYDEDYLGYYFRPYFELTNRFKEEGKFDQISPKHFFTNKERGIEYLLLKTEYDNAQGEWEKFKKIRELQVWWAHYKIMRLTHGVFSLKDKDNYFHNDSLIDSIYLYDFNQVAQGKDTILLRRINFEEWIKRLHSYLKPRLATILKSKNNGATEAPSKIYLKSKLTYYPDDGIAEFKGKTYSFIGKARALLELLNSNKGTPYSVVEIKNRCNPNISTTRNYFKGDKDTRDCVSYIKEMLKVKKSEYFPIQKINNSWIWLQR